MYNHLNLDYIKNFLGKLFDWYVQVDIETTSLNDLVHWISSFSIDHDLNSV
jgi:hypothetical protein